MCASGRLVFRPALISFLQKCQPSVQPMRFSIVVYAPALPGINGNLEVSDLIIKKY